MLIKSALKSRYSSMLNRKNHTSEIKDTILFVNAIRPATFEALEKFYHQTGLNFRPLVIIDENIRDTIIHRNGQHHIGGRCEVIHADFDSPQSLRNALIPYKKRIFAVTSQYENSIHELKKLIPYFPYLSMPTEKSLEWSTEKKLMREMLSTYDSSLAPAFAEALDASEATIASLEKTMRYPLMVKPSGLEGSLLVNRVDNTQELRNILAYTFKEIQKGYDTWVKRQAPAIVVEEFMEGDMYSVDVYVAEDGSTLYTPPLRVITGRNIGFDDFFGYARFAPSGLTEEDMRAAQQTSGAAASALCLRSITAHVELMKTAHGWKVIELGPRIGGYRHDIYAEAYDINHIMNDVLNRAGKLKIVENHLKKSAAVFNIYAREEGTLIGVSGLDVITELPSYVWHKQAHKTGFKLNFAKNNGDPVIELMLSHANKDQFDEDVACMERVLEIHVEPT